MKPLECSRSNAKNRVQAGEENLVVNVEGLAALSCIHFTYDSQCFTHTHTHKTICLVHISLMIPNASHTHTKPSVLYTFHL